MPGTKRGFAVVWSNLNPAMAQQLQVLLEDLESQ
jgi:hypothetical protein